MFGKLLESLWRMIDLYLLCRRRKDLYLRKQGAQIGQRCQIITDVKNFGSEPYLIRIGDDVTVTSGVVFITHDASTRLFRRRYPDMNRYGNLFGPVSIGDNCFIGVNTILLPGTVIGANSIIGAGALVKGVFPAESVLVGVPARRLCSLEEYIERVRNKMVPLKAQTRADLRTELVAYFADELGLDATSSASDPR